MKPVIAVLVVVLCACHVCAASNWTVAALTNPPNGQLFFGRSPQGVADDPTRGELIFSGKNSLSVVRLCGLNHSGPSYPSYIFNVTWQRLGDVIPPSLSWLYKHIGDVDFYARDNVLLVPVEEPFYLWPIIVNVQACWGGVRVRSVRKRYGNAAHPMGLHLRGS